MPPTGRGAGAGRRRLSVDRHGIFHTLENPPVVTSDRRDFGLDPFDRVDKCVLACVPDSTGGAHALADLNGGFGGAHQGEAEAGEPVAHLVTCIFGHICRSFLCADHAHDTRSTAFGATQFRRSRLGQEAVRPPHGGGEHAGFGPQRL